jgi:putative ABC transport system permease protein
VYLALKEMGRAKARFGLLISAIALLVFLILFQQSVQNGLLRSFTGAIEKQSAPVLVYSVDGQRVLQASVITPELESAVESADGVGRIGVIRQGTFTGAPRSQTDSTDVSVIGYDAGPDGSGLGAPAAVAEGRLPSGSLEGVASAADAGAGFGIGEVVRIVPGGVEITIVGLADQSRLNVNPTVFVSNATYLEVVRAVNPDAGAPPPNVLGVAPDDGVADDELVESINAQSLELDALTRQDAAAKTPGVAQVRQSFSIIFLLYALVVPCVTGLFFLIVTFQKAGALTLLKAIGAPTGRLVGSLLVQAAIVVAIGLALGTLFYLPVSRLTLGGVELQFEEGAVLMWSVGLLALGLGSSLVAARRVLRIDPMQATTGRSIGQ